MSLQMTLNNFKEKSDREALSTGFNAFFIIILNILHINMKCIYIFLNKYCLVVVVVNLCYIEMKNLIAQMYSIYFFNYQKKYNKNKNKKSFVATKGNKNVRKKHC
jgi:hypothetical protein